MSTKKAFKKLNTIRSDCNIESYYTWIIWISTIAVWMAFSFKYFSNLTSSISRQEFIKDVTKVASVDFDDEEFKDLYTAVEQMINN